MTTLVATNASGRKSTKDRKNTHSSNKNTNAAAVAAASAAAAAAAANASATAPNSAITAAANNSSAAAGAEDDLRKSEKFQPTAEQMRIASLMSSDKKDAENDLKPKIEQIVELTGASREDAAVALYDCDNDMTKAIEMILDGDALDSEWQSTGRKKKTKAQALAAGQLQTAALLDPSALTNGSKKGEKGGRGGAGGGQKNSLSNNNGGAPNRDASSGGPKGGPRGERGERSGGAPGASSANANSRSPRKREPRASGGGGDGFKGAEAGATNNTTTEENDIFAKASSAAANLPGGGAGVGGGGGDSAARRGGRRGGPRGGGRGGIGGGLPRGAPRGPGGPGDRGVGGGGGERGGGERSGGERGGRGTRTFMNRGLNNSQGGAGGVGGVEARTGNLASGPAGPNDGGAGFPNSIETWTNSSVQDQQGAASGKPTDDQMNQIGNWSDIVVNEDWSEEDWTAQPMETKVFTPSTKTIAEKDEPAAPLNHHNTSASQLSFIAKNNAEDSGNAAASVPQQPPTMSSVISASLNKARQTQLQQSAGQALLQQIQQNQPSQQQQPAQQAQVQAPSSVQSAPQQQQRQQLSNSNLNNHQQQSQSQQPPQPQQQQPTYHLSQYQKDATASIKSMVGLGGGGSGTGNELISSAVAGDSLAHVVKQQHHHQQQHHQQQQNRPGQLQKVQNSARTSKIPESAVEMPSASNDPIANLSVHFGSLEFGSNNFSLGGTGGGVADSSSIFDTSSLAPQVSTQSGVGVSKQQQHQQEAKQSAPGLSLLGSGDNSTNTSVGTGYGGRGNAASQQANKQQQQQSSLLQSSTVFAQTLNEPSASSVNDHHHNRGNDKQSALGTSSSYSANKNQLQQQQQQQKNDYLNSLNSYKQQQQQQVNNDVYSSFATAYGAQMGGAGSNATSGYYQHSQPFGSQSLQNMYGANSYNSVQQQQQPLSGAKGGRGDLDSSSSGGLSLGGQQSNAGNKSNVYDGSASSVSASLGLMNNSGNNSNNTSNSTATTNVIKNTLSASKGGHSVPPGVGIQQQQQQQQQQQTVLSTPFIMGNNMPMHYPYPYDMSQFPTARDHSVYPSYGAADVKYNRSNDGSDMLAPVSSQAAGAGLQTATQAHNQPYAMNTYPPGYGFYYNINTIPQQGHHYYGAAQHAMYPVQAQATGVSSAAAASSAFAKANTAAAVAAANYGSHSGYGSSGGYGGAADSLSMGVGVGGGSGGGSNSGVGGVGITDYGVSVGKQQTSYGGQQGGMQSQQQHKQIGGGVSANDLTGSGVGGGSGGGQQSMYGSKSHSAMNKSYDKQSFQQPSQFNMSSSQNASLSSAYGGNPYLLPNQAQQHQLHHGSMGSSVGVDQQVGGVGGQGGQQPPGVGGGPRSMQSNKGNSAAPLSNQSYKQTTPFWGQ